MQNPTSLIIIFQALQLKDQERLAEAVAADPFDSIFAFDPGSARLPPGVKSIPEQTIGRSLLRRLAFFADREHLPYMVAPLLVRQLWNDPGIGSLTIAYPGISWERLRSASELVGAGVEAVLLRRGDHAPIVLALARNGRNQHMVSHWTDLIDHFSSDPNEREQFDPFLAGKLVEYLCDRIGSIRQVEEEPTADEGNCLPTGTKITPFLRHAIRQLLPDFPQLLDDPFENAVEALNTPAAKVSQDARNPITWLMYLIWLSRADLQAAYDLRSADGRWNLVQWFLHHAPTELGITDEFLKPVRAGRKAGWRPATRTRPADALAQAEPAPVDPAAGVNLVGYPRAEMGMGELIRQSAAALSTTGLPFCLVDFSFGIIASQQDNQYEDLIRTDNPFAINVFHINADQMLLAREKLGAGFFRDHYNIGYWAWELSNFPDEWLAAIDLVDEIWVLSRFMQEAIAKKTTKPVIWMPLAVEFPEPVAPQDRIRDMFGLPPKWFLFLHSFDFSSFATRKNFLGCIEAFRRAFAGEGAGVGLVLKTIRHPHHKREFWELLRAIGDDRRIFLLDRVLRQPKMRELMAACDSFVSLHRSEGFGLGIAESMYLGKPVIVTNYSGNADFCKEDNCCLVNYRLIPVKPGEYVFPEGQAWADPDLDQAARHMQLLARDREQGKRLGAAAAAFMRTQHSGTAAGGRYWGRLQQIREARSLLASPVLQKAFAKQEELKPAAPSDPRSGGAALKSALKKLFPARY